MKVYTIIGGVNGVGKSSFTGVLKSRTTDLGEISAEAEAYRQSLLKEKRRAESGLASDGPSSSGTA